MRHFRYNLPMALLAALLGLASLVCAEEPSTHLGFHPFTQPKTVQAAPSVQEPVHASTAPPPSLHAGDAPYDTAAAPLDNRDFILLIQSGYRLLDARIYPEKGTEAVGKEELTYILEDLRSRRKLKALIQLELLFNRNHDRKVSGLDREALRSIGKAYWGLLPSRTREELRPYFSVEELEGMNREMSVGPAPGETLVLPPAVFIPDQSVLPSTSAAQVEAPAPPAPAPVEAAALPAEAPAPKPEPVPSAPPPSPMTAFAPLTPLGVAQSPAPPAPVAAPPVEPAPAAAAPAAQPPQQAAAAPAAPTPEPSMPSIPPVPVEPVPAAPPSPPVQAQAPQPAPPPVQTPAPVVQAAAKPVEVYKDPAPYDPAAFKTFLESAPYGRDVKPLLELLGAHAREPERSRALGLVRDMIPRIVLDSTLAGAASHSVSLPAGADPQRPGSLQVAVHDGPVLLVQSKLFSKREIFLPDSPQFYLERGLRIPSQSAFSRESASEAPVDEDLGLVRSYPDGSKRLKFSSEQLAGQLLAALLDADALLRFWKPDAHVRLRSETARFRFYKALAKSAGKEPHLDRESAAAYQEWLDRPEDFMDLVLQTYGAFSGRARELRLLEAAGLMTGPEAKKALEALPKPSRPAGGEHPVGSPQAREQWLELDRFAREEK